MAKKASKSAKPKDKTRCGIVMPISAMPDCPKAHWGDVLDIIREALEDTFSINLVSDADETRVIQGRIVQSLYDDPIVVCDVSCRNSNVMFELGIRIALDRPVVVIKDDVTDFSFDYSPLAHLIYPRSLAHKEICAFKLKLASAVAATLAESEKPDYQSFLKTFAPRVVAGRLEAKEVSEAEFIAEKLDAVLAEVQRINDKQPSWPREPAEGAAARGAGQARNRPSWSISSGTPVGVGGRHHHWVYSSDHVSQNAAGGFIDSIVDACRRKAHGMTSFGRNYIHIMSVPPIKDSTLRKLADQHGIKVSTIRHEDRGLNVGLHADEEDNEEV